MRRNESLRCQEKKLQWSSDRNPSAHIKMETNALNVIMLLKEKPNEEHAEEGKNRLYPGEGGAGGAGASSNRCPGTILGLDLKFHKNCVWTISS